MRSRAGAASRVSACRLRAPRFLARAYRRRPPRTGGNADALPPSSRDTGNRISFAGLRGCWNARFRSEAGPEAESRVQFRLTRRGFAATGSVSLQSAAAGSPSRRAPRSARCASARRPGAIRSGTSECCREADRMGMWGYGSGPPGRFLAGNIDGRGERIGPDHRFAQASRASGGADRARPERRCAPRAALFREGLPPAASADWRQRDALPPS